MTEDIKSLPVPLLSFLHKHTAAILRKGVDLPKEIYTFDLVIISRTGIVMENSVLVLSLRTSMLP